MESVVQLTKAIDQFVFERFLAGQNPAIGNRITQLIGWEVPLLRNDAEKLVVSFHDEVLHKVAFFRRDWSGAIEHVFKFAALKYNGRKAYLVEQLLIIQRLNDDADAAGDGCFVCH